MSSQSSDADWTPEDAETGSGAAASSDTTIATTADGHRGPKYNVTFDPGTVNCGMAVYNLWTRKICLLVHLQFRESRPAGEAPNDPGHVRLQLGTLQVLSEHSDIFSNSVVFLEDQPPLYGKFIPDAQRQTRAEVRAVQLTIQAFCLVQGIPVHAIGAMSYKQYMGHVMPHCDDDDDDDLDTAADTGEDRAPHSDKQKQLDRRNAITWCRANLPAAVVDRYEKSTRNMKKDDAYEAAILALYTADVWFNDDGTLRAARRPLVRRKKADVHPRGRPAQRKPKEATGTKRARAGAGAGAGAGAPKRPAKKKSGPKAPA